MTKFYTGKGDDGRTGLLGERRVHKYHPRIQAVGAIDEATAHLGMARSHSRRKELDALVKDIQRDLYKMMSLVSALPENAGSFPGIERGRVDWLEEQIERFGAGAEAPQAFILPGDTPGAAAFAVARTVVRRAERHAVKLQDEGLIDAPEVLAYLNRLSSLCFVLELYELDAPPTLAKDEA